MALPPLTLPTLSSAPSIAVPTLPDARNNPSIPVVDKVPETTIERALDESKESSLLYQLVTRLLLDEQDKARLSASIERTSETTVQSELNNTSTVNISFVESLSLEQGSLLVDMNIDGVEVSVTLEWTQFTQQQRLQVEEREADPLVLDLNGDGVSFTNPSDGILFDIDNDGVAEQVAGLGADDVFLALDLNNNGRIDNVSELFGDQTGFQNGFEALKAYDENNDLTIDSRDRVFGQLLTAQLSGNEQFLSTLKEQGITSINLEYMSTDGYLSRGSRVTEVSEYSGEQGKKSIVDVMLSYKELNT